MPNLRIALIGLGGELDSTVVENASQGDQSVTNAVIEMIRTTPLWDGDTITVRMVGGN